MEEEQKYCATNDMYSIVVARQEIAFYKKGLESQNMSQGYKQWYQQQMGKLLNILKFISDKYDSKQIGLEKYFQIIQKTLQKQQELLQQASKEGQKNSVARIESRIQILKQEILNLNKGKEEFFQRLISTCKQLISPSGQQQQQPQQNYQDQLNNLAIMIDKDVITEKVTKFTTRYKQYYNLATYYRNNGLEQKMQQRCSQVLEILGRFRKDIDNVKNDPNFAIGKFLVQDARELNIQQFQMMSQKQYIDKCKMMQDLFNRCMKQEQEFKKQAQNAAKKNGINPSHACSEKINKYMDDRKYLLQFSKSPYTPFPEVNYVKDEVRELTMQNPDIKPYTLLFKINRLIGLKSDAYMVLWSFTVNGSTYSYDTEYCDSQNVFNYSQHMGIGSKQNPCYGLHKLKIEVQIRKKGTLYGTNDYGLGIIPLQGLESECMTQGCVNLQHKDKKYQLEYGLYIHEAEFPKKFTVSSVQITKQYPEFQLNDGVQEYVNRHLGEIPQELVQQALKKQQYQKPAAQQQQQQQGNPGQSQGQQQQQQNFDLLYIWHTPDNQEVQILQGLSGQYPQGVTEEDVINLDCPNSNPSLTYIESYIPIIEEWIKSNTVRKEKKVAKKIQEDLFRQQIVLPQKVQNGDLSFEDYLQGLQDIQKRDKILAQFYQSNNCMQHYQFAMARLQIVSQEIEGAKQQMGDQEEDDEDDQNDQNDSQQQQSSMQVEEDSSQQMQVEQEETKEQVQPQQNQQLNLQQVPLCFLEHAPNSQSMKILHQVDENSLPEFIKLTDVLMPEDPERNQSLGFLNEMEPVLEEGLQKYMQDINLKEKKIIKKLIDEYSETKMKLQNKAQNGELSPDDYMQDLNDIMKRDEYLEKLYESKGLDRWVQFIQARRYIVQNEIQQGQ